MTETTHYEPPTLTEVGSVRSLTQADHLGFGQDGFLFFSAGTPSNPRNPGHGLS
ncbi:MAG TPA: lasso RiPP family leader peptide-containing protein [Acidimicrobiales bacterium]|nr:lasso RiPP family leader peptide-containing protein [Acidimicrobiales bacterium]